MFKQIMRVVSAFGFWLSWISNSNAAVDSYRYLHVTVETPWTIFLFLLVGVMAPFILMGVLVWRYAGRKSKLENSQMPAEECRE